MKLLILLIVLVTSCNITHDKEVLIVTSVRRLDYCVYDNIYEVKDTDSGITIHTKTLYSVGDTLKIYK